jgi:hypothetical protein
LLFHAAGSRDEGCFIIAREHIWQRDELPMEINTLTFGGVNCYLLSVDSGFLLIDTGFSKNRVDVEKGLESSGCKLET